jgi:hypothetical protein
MKKFIVTTTINAPTEAIELYDSKKDWELIVIGDKKTPKDYHLANGLYVSPEDQEKIDSALSDAIGWNCIQRRNFGILLAYKNGADIVALIDDDNIPLDNWGKNVLVGSEVECNYYEIDSLCFDPMAVTNYPHLWHRGFPLQLLSSRNYGDSYSNKVKVDIQADFWNGDPDVDAICRMEHNPECNFDCSVFPISSNVISPFNSQNTFIARKVLPDYFLYPHIGRMDDIWASFHTQAQGHTVIYQAPSVYQQRNPHDLTIDFNKEIIGYEKNYLILEELKNNSLAVENYLPEKSKLALNLYRKHMEKLLCLTQ